MQDGLGCEESFLLASFPSVGIQARMKDEHHGQSKQVPGGLLVSP
jgi:hypothetical protein